METRILIPHGLKIITTLLTPETFQERENPQEKQTNIKSDEEAEEKPSSSSGHCEASDNDRESDKEKPEFLDGKSSLPTTSNFSHEKLRLDASPNSSSFENDSSDTDEESESSISLIGSSFEERGRKRGRSEKTNKRRKKRRRSNSNKTVEAESDLPKQHQDASSPNQLKICATRIIEKGTVFSANDGDVQVVHLTGIPAIAKDDIRFLFGCFETISSVPPSTPPPEISSASTSTPSSDKFDTAASLLSNFVGESKFIRLCNWVRFLNSTEKFNTVGNNATTTATTTKLPSESKNVEGSFPPSENETVCNISINSSSSNINNESQANRVKKCNNIIARFVDGRPIFEVIARLVPGTELVAYFDMESAITQATSISPFAAMMMIQNMQMGVMSQFPPSTDNISSSTPTSTSTLISSSSSPPVSSTLLATAGFGYGGPNLGKNDFVPIKCMRDERDERGQKQHHLSQQDRLLHFYHNAFPTTPQLQHFPFGLRNYGNWLRSTVLDERDNSGSPDCSRNEEKNREVKVEKNESGNEDKSGIDESEHEHHKIKGGSEAPLDLSKLSTTSTNPSHIRDDPRSPSSRFLRSPIQTEPLKIGTPFDSPDSNDEVVCKVNPIKENESLRSSSIFSIRNVLGKQSSPKLFQPYSLDHTTETNKISCGGGSGNYTTPFGGQGFRTSSLSTPPSSSDSPVSVVARNSSVRPILRTRGRERSLLPCDVCGKAFDRPSLLKRHLRTHTGEKPHICDVCTKGFSTSSSLNTHRRIHSGEKPHQCPVCGKRFTASSNLYYHRMTHNKEKPHKCTCGKSFPTPGDLKSHQYVHSGSWPYTCPVCHRGFSKQTNLRNHLLLHSSGMTTSPGSTKLVEKPHVCQICDKKFSQACNLRAHIRSHEEEQKPALSNCTNCKQTFPQSLILDGRCQNCLLTLPSSLSSHNGSGRGIIFGESNNLRKQPSNSSSSASQHQFSQKMIEMSKAQNLYDQALLQHRNSSTDSQSIRSQNQSPATAVAVGLSLQQTLSPNVFHPLGSLGLPHFSGFSMPSGLSLSSTPLAPPSPVSGGITFPLTPPTPSTPGSSSVTAAAAAAAAANLLRTSTGGAPTSLHPNSNAILEQFLEWNYRVARESAGNLSLSIVQQKLLESQVLAAQIMSQQCSQQQQQPSAFVSGIGPVGGNFQEYLKMKTSSTAVQQGFSRIDAITGENKFGQH